MQWLPDAARRSHLSTPRLSKLTRAMCSGIRSRHLVIPQRFDLSLLIRRAQHGHNWDWQKKSRDVRGTRSPHERTSDNQHEHFVHSTSCFTNLELNETGSLGSCSAGLQLLKETCSKRPRVPARRHCASDHDALQDHNCRRPRQPEVACRESEEELCDAGHQLNCMR